jgi:single-stranded DNA-binding protein
LSLAILAQGTVISEAQRRTAKTGAPFCTFTLRVVQAAQGDEENTLLVSCVCFHPETMARCLSLARGDSIAITGRAQLKTWQGKDGRQRTGLSVIAEQCLTVYEVRKKRGQAQAALLEPKSAEPRGPAQEAFADMENDPF